MKKRSVNTQEQKVGQDQSYDLPVSGPVGDLEPDIIHCDAPRMKSKAKELAFMDETVAVRIHDTGNKNEEQYVEVDNGGIPQFVERGKWQKVKRKFVEVLARAKAGSVSTPEFENAAGDRATRIQVTQALKYPFEMRDNNPDGHVWLQRVLAEG